MFKNMKLGTKIILGFLAVVGLVAVAGTTGYWGVDKVGKALYTIADEESPIADASMEMALSLSECEMIGDELRNAVTTVNDVDASKIEECKKAFEKSEDMFDKFATAIQAGGEVDGVKIIKSTNQELVEAAKGAATIHDQEFKPAFLAMVETGKKIVEESKKSDAAMSQMEADFTSLAVKSEDLENKLTAIVDKHVGADATGNSVKEILTGEIPLIDCAMEIKYLIAKSRIALEEIAQAKNIKTLEESEKEFRLFTDKYDEIATAMIKGGNIDGKKILATDNKEVATSANALDSEHGNFTKQAETIIAMKKSLLARNTDLANHIAKIDDTGTKLNVLVKKVEELSSKEMDDAKKEGGEAKQTAVASLIVIVVASILLGLFIGIALTRSITRILNRIVLGLSEGSEQVASASGQVSSASQSLAEGSTEQAASLEETSSALEEMASMTRQNADNAKTANSLAATARDAAEDGNCAMGEMLTAMKAINDSSSQISKIIKVIEEIAFQTNLLALNAAVEAARAGDAGKGFAVVADEVRNLAQRAAAAAKDTTTLIEDSVGRTSKGQEIANKSNEALKNIVSNVKKVADLVGEISAASQEQAQGIDQVNTAVAQMDKVTQSNAANAEESASASEELSAQALNLKDMVQELVNLVGGASAKTSVVKNAVTTHAPLHLAHNTPATTAKHNNENGKVSGNKHGLQLAHKETANRIKSKPEELIPLGEEDFKGF